MLLLSSHSKPFWPLSSTLLFLTLQGKETNFRGHKLTQNKEQKNKNKIKKTQISKYSWNILVSSSSCSSRTLWNYAEESPTRNNVTCDLGRRLFWTYSYVFDCLLGHTIPYFRLPIPSGESLKNRRLVHIGRDTLTGWWNMGRWKNAALRNGDFIFERHILWFYARGIMSPGKNGGVSNVGRGICTWQATSTTLSFPDAAELISKSRRTYAGTLPLLLVGSSTAVHKLDLPTLGRNWLGIISWCEEITRTPDRSHRSKQLQVSSSPQMASFLYLTCLPQVSDLAKHHRGTNKEPLVRWQLWTRTQVSVQWGSVSFTSIRSGSAFRLASTSTLSRTLTVFSRDIVHIKTKHGALVPTVRRYGRVAVGRVAKVDSSAEVCRQILIYHKWKPWLGGPIWRGLVKL